MAASFAADLLISGKTFTVLTCEYTLSQPTDPRGRPSAGVRSGLLRISLVGSDYAVLTEWAINPRKALNGQITFRNMGGQTLKTLSFEKGYCVSYREIFTPHEGVTAAYTFDIGITAAKVLLNGTLHDNQWLDWHVA
ncbi:type VI secretion system tube protein TssD [uncultured Spirosoma sp.]|uniref:type VI secretion system tube protein TssD n=1 Tax=uncultured Spirosoma sp. TaxID=278208 RepID=UPI00258827BE|nr:type VI secretion system tube protein TssD [uncultured Spirosoma sp.]